MRRIITMIAQLPRAGRWALLAGAFIAGYFLILEPALDLTQRWRFEGDALQAALEETSRSSRGAESAQSSVLRGASLFGPIRFPVDSQRTADGDLNSRVVEVFRAHGVPIASREKRAIGSLGRDAFSGAIGPEQEVRRLVIDVEFTAAPETALAIIADLEASAAVHGLGRVHMQRTDDAGPRQVRVNISPETWFIAERGS